MDLTGRVALITGGGTGLGRAIALALAARGSHIAISYRESQQEALSAVAAIKGFGVRAAAFRADVALPTTAMALVEAVETDFGALDILINNAAQTVVVPFEDLASVDAASWDTVLAVNLRAPFLLARAARDQLRAAGGAIVNVASTAGLAPRGSSIPYSVSKAALIHLTRCLAVAMAPHVRVTAIAPGNMPTGWARSWSEAAPRPADTDVSISDVVDAVLLAISNDGITGTTIVVDAGLTAK